MADHKETLLRWIENDRDKLVEFLSRFIQAKSPNPPGDTRAASEHIMHFLDEEALPYRVISPKKEAPNIISSFECGEAGRHLVFNGHIDVFPASDDENWTQDPWSGTIVDGCIFGRGAADMKCGTTASIFTFAYLHRIRERLKGKLTLTCVSEEEILGPWGARYLLEHHPEVLGDCCLSGEPSTPNTFIFGEKGKIELIFTIRTHGAHGAYTHLSPSATKIAAQLITDLETLTEIQVPTPENVESIIERYSEDIDQAAGQGAAKILQKVTVNIGTIRGGVMPNMIPSDCVLEADIRLPIGLEKESLMAEVQKIVSQYPEITVKELMYIPANWCEPDGEMAKFLRTNVKILKGFEPVATLYLALTDARLWRDRNIPAYVYGPHPHNMAAADEYVEIEEFLHIVKIHTLSAYDYLTQTDKETITHK